MNHAHDHCCHEHLAYCPHCLVAYCKDCGKEWHEWAWTCTSAPSTINAGPTWVYETGPTAKPSIDLTPKITCNHT